MDSICQRQPQLLTQRDKLYKQVDLHCGRKIRLHKSLAKSCRQDNNDSGDKCCRYPSGHQMELPYLRLDIYGIYLFNNHYGNWNFFSYKTTFNHIKCEHFNYNEIKEFTFQFLSFYSVLRNLRYNSSPRYNFQTLHFGLDYHSNCHQCIEYIR